MVNNPLVRWERYAPVGIGLEDMFRRLDTLADSSASTNYPHYNIIKTDDHTQVLEVALAGWKKEDIEVSLEQWVLNISVQTSDKDEVGQYVHKGIAKRTFSRNWQLSDDVQIEDVTYENGLLRITLRRVVPEEQKRKVFDIS